MLRLTLRTLLSYLDDTLEPTQAKQIGQKVAESEQAQELIERIRQVTRRRRLTTPSMSGPGGIDPNTIAEYLDNEVAPEQASEVEQICLASDVHLAEVAASHQILTLVLGEPIVVPPAAKRRMVALVKGPEAVPTHKRARKAKAPVDQDLSTEMAPDHDETLRLPSFLHGGARNAALLAGGGVLAAGLLVLALWQLLNTGHDADNENQVVQVVDEKKPTEPKADAKPVPDEKKQADERKAPAEEKKSTPPLPEIKDGSGAIAVEPTITRYVPFGPADTRQVAVAQYVAPSPKHPTILLASEKGEWKRVGGKNGELVANRPLLSLPANHNTLQLGKGVEMILWGNVPEMAPIFGYAPLAGNTLQLMPAAVNESMVTLHPTEELDGDLTLQRGRIILTNTSDRPVTVRVRFDDPKKGKQEYADVELTGRDASALVQRWSYYPLGEPFYPNPDDPARVGPTVQIDTAALAGIVGVKHGDVTHTLGVAPMSSLLSWNSVRGVVGPTPRADVPPLVNDSLTLTPPLPKGMEPRTRIDMQKAQENLARNLAVKTPDVALPEALESPEAASRRLVVRSYGALDDLASLLDGLVNEKQPDVRQTSLDTLRSWIALDRKNDYRLLDQLKEKYRAIDAQRILELLHLIAPQDVAKAETYEILIANLDHKLLPIRELSAYHLYLIAPAGRAIPYDPTGPAAARQETQRQWRPLIPRKASTGGTTTKKKGATP